METVEEKQQCWILLRGSHSVCVCVLMSAQVPLQLTHSQCVLAGVPSRALASVCLFCWLNFEHAYESALFISAFSRSL